MGVTLTLAAWCLCRRRFRATTAALLVDQGGRLVAGLGSYQGWRAPRVERALTYGASVLSLPRRTPGCGLVGDHKVRGERWVVRAGLGADA